MSAPQVVTVAVSGPTARYFSTQRFISKPTDTPANTPFLPRVKDTIEYTREVGCTAWGNSRTQAAIGTIDLINTDGALDSMLTEVWRDRIVTIRRGLETQAYDDHEHVAYAVVDRVTTPDFYTIRLTLRDKGALLDVPLQRSMYPALIQAPTLEGTHRPVCIGECEGVPLTLVNAGELDYDVHDDVPLAIDEVTDKGVILNTNTSDPEWEENTDSSVFGIKRLTNPAGKQVAKVRGQTLDGSVLIERLPDLVNYALERSDGRVYPYEVEPYTVNELDAATEYKLCYWGRDATTISSLLTQALDSFTGWWYFDRLGLFRVARLIDPEEGSESPAAELNDINLVGQINMRFDEARGLSDSIGCVRNWSPHGDGDIASSVTTLEPSRAQRIKAPQQVRTGTGLLHASYAHAVGAEPIKTLLSQDTDGQLEANRLTALYERENYFYEVTAALEGSQSYTLEPGQTVRVTTDRFGMSAGRILLVVAVRTRLMSSLVSLVLWGRGPDAGDFPSES